MAPAKTENTEKTGKKQKKEKVFHPESRKAGQLTRTYLRKTKLAEAASKRAKKHSLQADVYGFFYHALPPEGVLKLEELHSIVKNIWLPRHDLELEEERSARRKGRPKSTKEMKLEEIQLREAEAYRTGMEVPDLTHAATVELFRRWDQKEVPYLEQLRFIRISGSQPAVAVVSRPGKHHTLKQMISNEQDQNMDVVSDFSLLSEAPSRFASTIMTMDEPF